MSRSELLSTPLSSQRSGPRKRERAQSHCHQQQADLLDHDSCDTRTDHLYPLKDTDQPHLTSPSSKSHAHHHHHHNNNGHQRRKKSASPRVVNTSEANSTGGRTFAREKSENESPRDQRSDDYSLGTAGEGDSGTVVLVRKIGQGSCGAVYLGRHPQTHRDYAVKLIPKDAGDQRTARLLQRVRLEGDLLLMLDHPHIVRGYGVMETDDHAFLFMEHAQGGDLLEYLNREGALNETRARLMFRQVVRAVRHLHQNGWVHRDIKPENIFIAFEEDEQVTMERSGVGADRGTEEQEECAGSSGHQHDSDAKATTTSRCATTDGATSKRRSKRIVDEHANGGTDMSSTSTGMKPTSKKRRKVRLVLGDMGFARQWAPTKKMQECVGTFPYAAPEVINRGKYVGPEVDVWSLGAVLLAMLTAQMPFGAPTEEMSRALAAAGQFCVPQDISDAALDLLASMLQPSPEARITLDGLWRHPWMRMTSGGSSIGSGLDRGSTAQPSVAAVGESQEKESKLTTKDERKTNKKKKKKKEKEQQEKQDQMAEKSCITEEIVDTTTTNQKKRSRVRRAATLLFRRTTNAVGAAKMRGRSTSAMASSTSTAGTVSNDRVRTLATA